MKQADQAWAEWLEARETAPNESDVRVNTGRSTDGSYRSYLVRPQVLLIEADEVIVVVGHGYEARRRMNKAVVAKANNRASIVELADALRTESHNEELALMTPADPTIVFLRNRTGVIASIGAKDNRWICCAQWWPGDAPLLAPELLQDWLTKHRP